MMNPMNENRNEFRFHPKNVLLFLLLAGLSFLFLALSAAYVYTRITKNVPPVRLPALFLLNTLILLGSSWTMIRARRCYLNDDTHGYLKNLLFTIQLSLIFAVMQTAAWWLLFKQNIHLNSSTTAGYLYVISFVHLAHVLGGLPWLIVFYQKTKKHMVDPVTVLVYFSNPEKRLHLRLLAVYWHFLDILWIYLVVFFGLNYLI